MSLTPRLTLIGMYNYDHDLFRLLSLPDGMDKDLLLNRKISKLSLNAKQKLSEFVISTIPLKIFTIPFMLKMYVILMVTN